MKMHTLVCTAIIYLMPSLKCIIAAPNPHAAVTQHDAEFEVQSVEAN